MLYLWSPQSTRGDRLEGQVVLPHRACPEHFGDGVLLMGLAPRLPLTSSAGSSGAPARSELLKERLWLFLLSKLNTDALEPAYTCTYPLGPRL